MSEKPEWFELAGEEQRPQSPKPKNRLLKVALISAPLILIGGIYVTAQGEGGGDDLPSNTNSLSNSSISNSNISGIPKPGISTPDETSNLSIKPATNDPDLGAGLDRPKRIGEDDNEGFHHEDQYHQED